MGPDCIQPLPFKKESFPVNLLFFNRVNILHVIGGRAEFHFYGFLFRNLENVSKFYT